MKDFNGEVLFLDRSDINTDEIIPAKYLTEISKEALKPHLLEDLNLPGFSTENIEGKKVIVTRDNFGCGSSREHAPWALEVNGINLVIAPGFARIFRQNMYNCGMMAMEIETETVERLFQGFYSSGAAENSEKRGEVTVTTDLKKGVFTFHGYGKTETVSFSLPPFDEALIQAGGWVDFADSRY